MLCHQHNKHWASMHRHIPHPTSSEASPQSLPWSHLTSAGKHLPFPHVNSSTRHTPTSRIAESIEFVNCFLAMCVSITLNSIYKMFFENALTWNMYGWDEICTGDMKYVRVTWTMYGWHKICTGDMNYVRVRWNMYGWHEICTGEIKYVRVTWNMYGWDEICTADMKYVRVRWNMYGWHEICTGEMKYVRLTWNMYGWDEILIQYINILVNSSLTTCFTISRYMCNFLSKQYVWNMCNYVYSEISSIMSRRAVLVHGCSCKSWLILPCKVSLYNELCRVHIDTLKCI